MDRALSWIDDRDNKMDEKVRAAIRCRLIFRHDFLLGLEQDIDIIETRDTSHFTSCASQLSSLSQSVPLGKPVPESFSCKIQRKLASTVPPRPMVKISPEEALAHVTRLCRDAVDVLEILEYQGPYNLKVRCSRKHSNDGGF